MESNEETETTSTTTSTTEAPLNVKDLRPKVTLTDADKENFFKAYLKDVPYSEVVTVANGKFSYEFRTLQADERADIIRQINRDHESGAAENNDAYFIQLNAYAAAMAMVNMNKEPFCPDITKDTFKSDDKNRTYIKARAERLMKLPDYKLSSLLNKYSTFETKVIAMMEAINEPNF